MAAYIIAVCLLLAHHVSVTEADLAPTWDYCNCRWEDWESWSDCTSDCFGKRVRTRSVWLTEHEGCDEFDDCATGGEGSDWKNCNEVCHNGGVASGLGFFGYPCLCKDGYYSSCCTERVNCGDPGSISDGTVSVTSTYYGGTATYSCYTNYNMSVGDRVRKCQKHSTWSGSQPSCIFSNHCGSSPCMNGATCVNLLGDFRCHCLQGWSGQLCENDVQSPVMSGCGNDVFVNATERTIQYNWTAPVFSDPMGSDLDIVSNYPSAGFKFPWGDHTVQYVATKISNGLVTECTFQIKVRPTPCEELNIPKNGARLCNGWQTEFGQFCMITCQQNYTIPPSQNYYTWYVCGASGTWIPASPLPDCEVEVESEAEAEYYHPEYSNYVYTSSCNIDVTKEALQTLYIEKLKQTKGFSSFCTDYGSECTINNVNVHC